MTPHILFTGGGTGGHLFPGLAVASELVDLVPGARITFVGSGTALERQLVEAVGFPYLSLACRPLPRSPWQAIQFIGDSARGCWQAGRLLHHLRASAVVGLGGFASVPLARAAIGADVPLVLLEQNAWPGRATRWLAPGASVICTAFELPPDVMRCGGPVRVTGNPIRAGFDSSRHTPCAVTVGHASGLPYDTAGQRPTPRGTRSVPATLVILGGSQGARTLNRCVPRALHRLRRLLWGWEIIHQSGERDCQATQMLYARLGLKARVLPFISDMPELLSRAHLAISRAGGTTLAELAAAAVPAVLVPYPHATDQHQQRNARIYVDGGGCVAVEQTANQQFGARLTAAIEPLLADDQLRHRMSHAMQRLARPDAAWRVATLIAKIAQSIHQAFAA